MIVDTMKRVGFQPDTEEKKAQLQNVIDGVYGKFTHVELVKNSLELLRLLLDRDQMTYSVLKKIW